MVLRAIVIIPNETTKELGDLLAISRSQAKKREHSDENIPIRALHYIEELGVYVAVYEVSSNALGVKGWSSQSGNG